VIPKNAKLIPLRPLALGEVSGHHHSLCALDDNVDLDDVAQMYEVADEQGTRTYLRVTGDCVALTHQEHKAHTIPPGDYCVLVQQENTDWGAAQVRD
jgi:hypothetical protein